MKKNIEEVKIFKTVYIADDGARFDSEQECEEYEKNRSEIISQGIERCFLLDECAAPNGEEHFIESHHYWYYPKNSSDIDYLNNLYGLEIDDDYLNQWINIEYSPDDNWASACTLNDCISYVRNILSALGYKMDVQKNPQ